MTPGTTETAAVAPIGGLLLAAGRGTRLRPLTDVLPKPAVPLLDLPLASFALAAMGTCCARVAVNVSHLSDLVSEALEPYAPAGTAYLREVPEPLGSGGTLGGLRGRTKDLVVTRNADMLTDLAMDDLLAAHERAGVAATVAVRAVASGADFELAGERVVELINRKVDPDRVGFEFIGTTVFSARALDVVIAEPPVDLVRAFLVPLLGRAELAAFIHTGYALDVGTTARYLRANLDLLADAAPAPPSDPPGEVVDVPGGRAYLGPEADVGGADVGPGAVVLRGAAARRCRIADSVVWPGEVVEEDLERTVFAFGRKLL